MTVIPLKHFLPIVLFIAVSISAVPQISNATEWKGHEVERDGIKRVINPSTAAEPERIRTATKIWHVGESNEDVLFGPISDMEREPEGVSFLMDPQLNTVHVISPKGEYLRSIGREEEGPGEFSGANDIMLLRDGTVCVLQIMPARAVLITAEGDAAGEHPLPKDEEGGYIYLNGGSIAGDRIFLHIAQFIQRETMIGLETSFVRIDSDGNIVTTYWELLQEADLAKITFDEKSDISPIWAVGADGRFFVNNSWDAYSIEVIGPDGTPEYIIEREYETHARTPRDFARIDSLKEAGAIAPPTTIAANHRAVSHLLPRDNGKLWVLSSRGERDIPQNTIAQFDVFDRRGRFVRQVVIRAPCVPERDGFFFVGDYVYTVTNIGEFSGSHQNEFAGGVEVNPGEISVTCSKIDRGP
jgi:hypothetical protein